MILIFCIWYGLFCCFRAKMSMYKKRKKDDESEWIGGKKRQRLPSNQRCILHTSEASNIGNVYVNYIQMKSSKFCVIYETEDWKKKQILNINCMEDVCQLIPDFLSDVDLENTGWHWGCNQRFAINLNRLQSVC